LTSGHRCAYTPTGGPGLSTPRAALLAGGSRLNEDISLPPRFVDAPIFRQWSGDSQKLYFWLRARVGRDAPLAPDEYRELRNEGYLVAYATADDMMDRAVECSRNTLTKLIRDLAELGVAQVRPTRRGYIFVLGERSSVTTRWMSRPLDLDVFYLDQIVGARSPSEGP
jgi:hypothetical protein